MQERYYSFGKGRGKTRYSSYIRLHWKDAFVIRYVAKSRSPCVLCDQASSSPSTKVPAKPMEQEH